MKFAPLTLPFPGTLGGHGTAINWPNFSIVSQGTGRSRRGREREWQSVEQSEHTQHLLINFSVLRGHSS